jgi:hypothetical protein
MTGFCAATALKCVRWSHQGIAHPLIERMVRSRELKASELGASWATAEYFQRNGACAELYQECLTGSPSQRIGVATILGQLSNDDEARWPTAATDLAQFFDDADPDVRTSASTVFEDDDLPARPSGPTLARSFVKSAAFAEHAESLMRPLGRASVDLRPYADVILGAAGRFATELPSQTRSMRYSLGLAGRDMSALLLRLYDAACKVADKAMAEACLDRWDTLLANRVGDAEAHLESFDS